MIAIDTSLSMMAEDITPNRLTRTKQEVLALLSHLSGDRVGLLAFAGSAHILVPRTSDAHAIALMLSDLDDRSVSKPGTNLPDVIRKTLALFGTNRAPSRALVIFTDGEQHASGLQKEINAAKRAKLPIYTVGVGRSAGEPIPVKNAKDGSSKYKFDKSGNVVLSQLDEATLKKIAQETGGRYFHATNKDAIAQSLYKAISQQEKKAISETSANQFKDQFQYPILLAILCLGLERILNAKIHHRKGPSAS